MQGSKIALVRSYLLVSQAAGQVKILIFLVKIKNFPMYANIFCDAGQVPISRYFETCNDLVTSLTLKVIWTETSHVLFLWDMLVSDNKKRVGVDNL